MTKVLHAVGLRNIGGIENLFLAFVEGLDGGTRPRHSVMLTKPTHRQLAARLAATGVPATDAKRVAGVKLPALLGLRHKHLGRIMDDVRPDALLCWSQVPEPSWIDQCRRRKIALLVYDHGLSWHVGLGRESDRLRACDGLIGVSRAAARVARERVGFPGLMEVVPNGLTIPEPPEPPDRSNAGPWRIGLVARLTAKKAPWVAVEALACLRQSELWPNVILEIAGDGPLRPWLEDLVARHGLGRHVRFHGIVQDMPALYCELDALVVPSIREPFGLVSIEAAASGVPVIVSNVDGLPETVTPGCGGFLVDCTVPPNAMAESPPDMTDVPEQVYDPTSDHLRAPRFPDPRAVAEQLQQLFQSRSHHRRHAIAAREQALRRFRFPDYVRALDDAVGRLSLNAEKLRRPPYDPARK